MIRYPQPWARRPVLGVATSGRSPAFVSRGTVNLMPPHRTWKEKERAETLYKRLLEKFDNPLQSNPPTFQTQHTRPDQKFDDGIPEREAPPGIIRGHAARR